jgi:hypothetical protein
MSAYTGDIVKDGLVLAIDAANYKSIVSGSTTFYDRSGFGNTGTLTNGPAYTGSNKGAIVLDGSNDYILANNTSLNSRFSSTVVSHFTWVYPTSAGQIVTELGQTNINTNWHTSNIEISTAGAFSFSTWHNGLTNKVVSSNQSFNQWYYLGFVYNGSVLTAYINGEPIGTATFGRSAPFNNGYQTHYALCAADSTNMGTNAYAGGRIGSFVVYNRALSAAEVRENYNATKGRYDTTRSSDAIKPRLSTSGLVLHLDAANYRSFVSGSTTWRDLSGNGFDGTLTNGPTYNSANNGFIVFDGTNDFVQCTGTIVTSTATFLVWMYRNGNQGQYDGVLFSRGTNVTGLGFFSSNQLGYHWNDNSNTYNWASGLTVPDLQWSLCAVSVGPTSATAYLCQQTGVTSAVNNVSHASTTLNDIKIGQDDFGGRFFAGNISVAQIYNRALSRDEIVQYFNYTKVRYGYVL